MCLCLSTQYLMALLTSISCFFVNPFGPTPPLKVIPAVGRKVAVKSWRLLYMLRRSRSSMLSPPWGGGGGGGLLSCWSRRWSALPACIRTKISTWASVCVALNININIRYISEIWQTLNSSLLFGTTVSKVALSSMRGFMICLRCCSCSQANNSHEQKRTSNELAFISMKSTQ